MSSFKIKILIFMKRTYYLRQWRDKRYNHFNSKNKITKDIHYNQSYSSYQMINHQVLILGVPIIYKINLMLVNSKIIINTIMQAGGIHREGEHLLLICLMIPIKWLILIDKDLLQIIRHKEIKSSKIVMNRMDA